MVNYRQPFRGEYPITQGYGEKDTSSFHTGIDYACPRRTEIMASAPGIVRRAGWDPYGYGYHAIIEHGDGKATLYAHLCRVDVSAGTPVGQGSIIGLSGDSGNSTGPHLHFEARRQWNDGRSHFDPMTLPLMSVDDNLANTPQSLTNAPAVPLVGPEAFSEGDIVKITAPLGAKAFYSDLFDQFTPYPQGSTFYYTGRTIQHNGYTYMQVIPMTRPLWVAVNDGETQILNSSE